VWVDALESRTLFATWTVNPGQSVQAAIDAAVAGDVVRLAAGTHNLAAAVNVKVGVTVEGVGVSTVVKSSSTNDYIFKLNSSSLTNGNQQIRNMRLDGNARANKFAIQANFRHNVKIRGITFDNFSDTTVNLRGAGWNQGKANRVSGIELGNCTFNNCGVNSTSGFKSGVVVIGTTNNAWLYNLTINSSGLGTHGIKYDWNAAGNEGSGGWNYGLKIERCNITTGADSFSIELFNSYANGTTACDFNNNTVNRSISFGGQKDFAATSDGILDARIHHNNITGYANLAIEVQGGDLEIDHNYIKNPGTYGIAIWNAGDAGPRKNYYIHDNVFEGDSNAVGSYEGIRVQGIRGNGSTGGMNLNIYNNTFHFMDKAIILKTSSTDEYVRNVNIRNNIFLNLGRGGIEFLRQSSAGTIDTITATNNLSYLGADKIDYGDFAAVTNYTKNTNYTTTNPQLAQSGAKPNAFYRPSASTSFVVGKGSSSVPSRSTNSFSGTPDIGALEWGLVDDVGIALADNFETQSVGSGGAGWTVNSGTWAVHQGTLSKTYRTSGSGIATKGSAAWSNYTLSADVTPESNSGGAALLFRVQSANRFYQLELKNNAGTKQLAIWKNNNGSWSQVAAWNYNWSAGTTYTLNMVCSGSTLTASVNGTQVGTATDGTWTSGYVGLRTDGMAAQFDNLSVILA
jgi:hypothetical protein